MTFRRFLAVVLSVGACGTEPQPDKAIGEYVLTTVNGTPVPAVAGNVKYYDGAFGLNADRSFAGFYHQGNPSGGQIAGIGFGGTWTRSHPDSITLNVTMPIVLTYTVWTDGQLVRTGPFEFERKTTQ